VISTKSINSQVQPLIDLVAPELTKLKAEIDTTNSCHTKKFRLSMWRLDKEELTKIIIAEQTFTLWNPELEIYKNKFSFSVDRDLIHITLSDSDIINKTICFDSLDFSYKFEISHHSRNIKASELACDPVMYLSNIKVPFEEEEYKDDEDYNNSALSAVEKKLKK